MMVQHSLTAPLEEAHHCLSEEAMKLDYEEAVDQLRGMMFQEQKYYQSSPDYMAEIGEGNGDTITVSWRKRICEWIFEVVDHFRFDREVAAIALNYLDRSVALELSVSPMTKKGFQLYAVASLYLAVKVHGETDSQSGQRMKLRVSAFEELSRGIFNVETIEAAEKRILDLLKWHVNPPTSAGFMDHLARMFPHEASDKYFTPSDMKSRLFNLARYLSELSCFSYSTSRATASVVAFASVLCAAESMSTSTTPIPPDVYQNFVSIITEATQGLSPHDTSVSRVRAELKALAPTLFPEPSPCLVRVVSSLEEEVEETEKTKDRESPNCVCEAEVFGSPRKRARFIQ
eukprot:Nitzschia sp. Nitz4//scaffold220_size35126//10953//11987//NITZ4_007830-RA/size35126-processed-gene-0.15-mRNA-1//-1//CDS//3329542529//5847//frame0